MRPTLISLMTFFIGHSARWTIKIAIVVIMDTMLTGRKRRALAVSDDDVRPRIDIAH